MWGEHFLAEFVFFDHQFKINIYVFATLGIDDLFLLLFSFRLLHFESPLLSVFLYFFDFLQMGVAFLIADLHK